MKNTIIYRVYGDIHDHDGTTHRGMLLKSFDSWNEAQDYIRKVNKEDWVSNFEIYEDGDH